MVRVHQIYRAGGFCPLQGPVKSQLDVDGLPSNASNGQQPMPPSVTPTLLEGPTQRPTQLANIAAWSSPPTQRENLLSTADGSLPCSGDVLLAAGNCDQPETHGDRSAPQLPQADANVNRHVNATYAADVLFPAAMSNFPSSEQPAAARPFERRSSTGVRQPTVRFSEYHISRTNKHSGADGGNANVHVQKTEQDKHDGDGVLESTLHVLAGHAGFKKPLAGRRSASPFQGSQSSDAANDVDNLLDVPTKRRRVSDNLAGDSGDQKPSACQENQKRCTNPHCRNSSQSKRWYKNGPAECPILCSACYKRWKRHKRLEHVLLLFGPLPKGDHQCTNPHCRNPFQSWKWHNGPAECPILCNACYKRWKKHKRLHFALQPKTTNVGRQDVADGDASIAIHAEGNLPVANVSHPEQLQGTDVANMGLMLATMPWFGPSPQVSESIRILEVAAICCSSAALALDEYLEASLTPLAENSVAVQTTGENADAAFNSVDVHEMDGVMNDVDGVSHDDHETGRLSSVDVDAVYVLQTSAPFLINSTVPCLGQSIPQAYFNINAAQMNVPAVADAAIQAVPGWILPAFPQAQNESATVSGNKQT